MQKTNNENKQRGGSRAKSKAEKRIIFLEFMIGQDFQVSKVAVVCHDDSAYIKQLPFIHIHISFFTSGRESVTDCTNLNWPSQKYDVE